MTPTKLKILTKKELNALVQRWKSNGEKIVFTNGCFDILHLGHIDYLEKARILGDKLIVGINSDASIKRIKGDNRPIVNEQSRLRTIASLEFVNGVVCFDEDTPQALIKEIIPDILVKGKDYEISNIVGSDIVLENGGKVETIELVDGYSTTAIIEKIKKL